MCWVSGSVFFPRDWACLCSLVALSLLGSCWFLELLRDIVCCSFTGCHCLVPAPGAAALAGLLSFASVFGHVGVFAFSCLVPSWPHLFAWFLLVFCHWLHVFPMCWVLSVFPSSCVLGVPSFVGGPVRDLGSCWFLGRQRKDSAAPLSAAAVRRLLPALRLLPAS